MKTLYFECNMGAAGDMLAAALLELHPDPEGFVRRMNQLGLPGVSYAAGPMEKCGVRGTHVTVTVNGEEEHSVDVPQPQFYELPRLVTPGQEGPHPHQHPHGHGHGHEHSHEHGHGHSHEQEHGHSCEHGHSHEHSHGHHHHHAGMADIRKVLFGVDLPSEVREDALEVYELIAMAESHAHGVPVEEVHFHEVGAMDAVADVVAVSWLLHELNPEQVLCSPIHVGSGQVRCAHGVLPVPAPATAHILRDVPIYGGDIRGELCTPTGAALLKHFAQAFGPSPMMRVEKIGYGMGAKEFEAANCVRAMLGETPHGRETIVELRCNLDDMTPEALGFAQERLWDGGALDVYTQPAGMKKNRPGVVLTCMCREADREKMTRLLFAHTTTLGVRETVSNRYTLQRTQRTQQTPFGPVQVKEASGWGTKREKPEYEDLARIAREQDMTLDQVKALLQ